MTENLLGLEFGYYDKMFGQLKKDYNVEEDPNAKQKGCSNKFNFFDKNTNKIAGNGYSEIIKYTEYSQPMFANAVIFKDGYQYGTSAKTEKDLNVFDYIIDEKNEKYALDLNGNHKVDKGEIFSGLFDRHAYKKAKELGNLNKYKEISQQYNL